MAQPLQLKAQISREVFRLFRTYVGVSSALIVILALYGIHFYQQEEFKHYKALISTKLESDIKTAFFQATDLTQSPQVWTALTDSAGRESFYLPELERANQTPNYKFTLLDYRGREFLRHDHHDVELMDVLGIVRQTLNDNQPHYEVLQVGTSSQLLVSLPIIPNFTDSMVGMVLMFFDMDKALASLKLPRDMQITYMSEAFNDKNFHFFQQGEDLQLAWRVEDADYNINIQLVQNQAPALLLIMSGLLVSLACGMFFFWRLKKWTHAFSVRTTSRLDKLVVLASDTLLGRNAQVAIDDMGDEISEVSSTLRDILQKQKAATDKLSIFSRVFETAAEAILVTNNKGLILDLNRALLEMTGYTKDDLIGQPAGRLYLNELSKNNVSVIAKSVQKDGGWRGETYFLTRQQQPIPVLLSVSVLRDAQGMKQGYVSVFSDITPIRQAEQQLKQLLMEDQLTKLPNYRGFLTYMDQRIHGEHFALLFMDLDHFKSINDTYGHDQGDEAIRYIAQHLKAMLPEGTFLCRRSGDEFIAVIPVREAITTFKEKLTVLFRPHRLNLNNATSTHFTATFSAGGAFFPDDSTTLSELLIFADTALLSAKESGRNQIKWLDLPLMNATFRKIKIDQKLTWAISQGKIHPHYQPEVDVQTGKITAFEALARWHDEELGHVSPSEFIVLAEQSGAIADLTQSLFTQVVADSHAIQTRFPGAGIALNSSPQLMAGQWLLNLLTTLASKRTNALQGFVLEITESDMSMSPEEIAGQLKAIMDLGLKIAIDDFGKSYSSLSRLASMPIQKLKIDMSFTAGLAHEENIKIVAGILALAHSLDMDVTAEGVENELQRDTLLALGCKQVQGYLYAKPLPLEDVLALPTHLKSVDMW